MLSYPVDVQRSPCSIPPEKVLPHVASTAIKNFECFVLFDDVNLRDLIEIHPVWRESRTHGEFREPFPIEKSVNGLTAI